MLLLNDKKHEKDNPILTLLIWILTEKAIQIRG
jgi:hypothetical protein